MNILEIIEKKRLNKELTKEELQYVVTNYLNKTIKDYQMSSLLMAICINGMTEEETVNLTNIMLNSGNTINLSNINGIIVDKHSTGGIGDKTTLIVAPLVAACGVSVAKMSGRGLGFTGGTIDKLESIPGFEVNIPIEKFIEQVNEINVCLCSGNTDLVPADKKIYALRDVTGTVSSIPLIASSIMSKKLASGANKIVIDLKVGSGAFMKTLKEAKELANLMIKIGKSNNKEVVCVLSNMEQPLGNMVGNSLEVKEAMETLIGRGPKDITELSLTLAAYMVSLGKKISIEEASELVKQKINDMSAYKKFIELVKAQNGDLDNFKIIAHKKEIRALDEGFINKIDAQKIGEISMLLGAGRANINDVIDPSVGIEMHKKLGDKVNINESLATIYYNKEINDIEKLIRDCFLIEQDQKEIAPLIYKILK